MGILRRSPAIGFLLLSLRAWTCPGAEPASSFVREHSEDEIKSAMLYNFTKFVAWPDGSMGVSGEPLVVGVLGSDELVPVLEAALRNKTVQGHPLAVRRLDSAADLKGCRVVFVGWSDRRRIDQALLSAGRSPTLTVGARAQFSRRGGVIAFVREGSRIRFEINLDAAERAHLRISSKLLRLGTVWREPSTQGRN